MDRPNQFKIHTGSKSKSTIGIQAIAGRLGYGVVWNDDINLAEAELWLNGKPAEDHAEGDV